MTSLNDLCHSTITRRAITTDIIAPSIRYHLACAPIIAPAPSLSGGCVDMVYTHPWFRIWNCYATTLNSARHRFHVLFCDSGYLPAFRQYQDSIPYNAYGVRWPFHTPPYGLQATATTVKVLTAIFLSRRQPNRASAVPPAPHLSGATIIFSRGMLFHGYRFTKACNRRDRLPPAYLVTSP